MRTKPVLIVIAGPNGSGKTRLTQGLRDYGWLDGCVYINPDQIAQDEFGDWNSSEASLQAAEKAEKIRAECLNKRQNLAFETVFSAFDKLRFLSSAMAAGYFIRLFFVCTDDPEINARRIIRRGRSGGHGVPTDKILGRFNKSIAQCAAAIDLVDRGYVYDNSIENAAPELLFRTREGRLQTQYRAIHPWARPIFNRLK